MPDHLHVDTPDTIDESAGSDPDHPLYDPDARLGGHDTMLEALHEQAEQVVDEKGTLYEVQVRFGPPEAWRILGEARAARASSAMQQLSDMAHAGDVLRAIPVRNITQLTLDVETTTRMKLS